MIDSIAREKVSAFLPQHFQERYVRLYVRDSDHADVARTAFEQWWVPCLSLCPRYWVHEQCSVCVTGGRCAKRLQLTPTPMATPRKRGRVSTLSTGAARPLPFLTQQ